MQRQGFKVIRKSSSSIVHLITGPAAGSDTLRQKLLAE
jgi:hypothetical protein